MSSEMPDIETSSASYAGRFAGAVGAWFLEVQGAALARLMRGMPPSQVLDVGGGHGQTLPPLLAMGHTVTVVGSADACKERIMPQVSDGTVTFVTANLLHLPFADRSVDVVVSFRLLCHMDAWRETLQELCRVARTSVIIDYPDRNSLNIFTPVLFNAKKSVEKNTRTYHCFKRREIVDECERHGFAYAGCERQFVFPMVLHRMLRSPALSRFIESCARVCGLHTVLGSPVIMHMKRTT